MPAVPVRNVRLNEEPHSGFSLERRRIKKPASVAEAAIDLLKSDEVGAELADNLDDTIRAHKAVDAPAFVDVIGRNLHGNLVSTAVQI